MAAPSTAEDFYAVLEVNQDATPGEITKSYRQLALKLHPDRNAESGSTQAFQLLGEAYETLKDEEKRRNYDYARIYRSTEVPVGQGWAQPQRTPRQHPRPRSPPSAPVCREELIKRYKQQQERRERESEAEREAFLQSTRGFYQRQAEGQATYAAHETTSQGAMEAYLRQKEEARVRAAQSGRQSKEDEIAQRQNFLYQQRLARATADRKREEEEAREAILSRKAKVRARAREAMAAGVAAEAAAEAAAATAAAPATATAEVGDFFVEPPASASAADADLEREVEEVAEAFNKL